MRRFLRMGAAVATLCCGGGALAQTKPEPIDPAGWVTHEDYPADGLLSRLSGVVEVEVVVDTKGGGTGCSTIKSSGSEILDNAACSALMARARFKPAQDATGRPVAGTYLRRVRWQMPDRPVL